METPIKLKKCSVKLNRLSFIGVTPGEVQEQILDQRIRRCAVRLQRCNEATLKHLSSSAKLAPAKANAINDGHKMRRCCIRLPRLNLARSEISSPAASVRILSEAEDFEQEHL